MKDNFKCRIKITASVLPSVLGINNIVGQTFDAVWDKERKLFYIQSSLHGGRIGIHLKECQIVSPR
jgi:hypothetical protein